SCFAFAKDGSACEFGQLIEPEDGGLAAGSADTAMDRENRQIRARLTLVNFRIMNKTPQLYADLAKRLKKKQGLSSAAAAFCMNG
ncbi:hypothetical protein K0U00_29095, partial [Paenibacillus sepulcri]|nr:hypothetical protein [Paenibacillus sepulcri]